MHTYVQADVITLATVLSEAACRNFDPGVKFVVDESIYAFEGETSDKRYIPRKPHPNGLLNYCLCGEILVDQNIIPIVLDCEPYKSEHTVGAQEAMMRLLRRFKERFPTVAPHFYVDSAFGSFDRLRDIIDEGTL